MAKYVRPGYLLAWAPLPTFCATAATSVSTAATLAAAAATSCLMAAIWLLEACSVDGQGRSQ